MLDQKIYDEFIEAMGDSAGMVLEMYRDTVPDIIQTILATDDAEVVHREVHGLKSNFRQIGAMELGEKAAEAEMIAKQGDIKTAQAKVLEVQNDWQLFEEVLREKLIKLAA